ncbi:MAG: YceI family protein [Bacteroidota bacterium]
MKKLFLIIFSFAILGLNLGLSQEMKSFAEGSELKVDGSSTLSDWSVAVKKVEGKFSIPEDFEGNSGQSLRDVLIVCQVKSMEGRGPDMNEKIYNAFKAEEHPQIIFEASEAISTGKDAEGFMLKSKGNLKMAGKSMEIELALKGKKTESGFEFWGDHSVDMTQFGMEPPTAFFGSLEVAKEVKVIFKILINA